MKAQVFLRSVIATCVAGCVLISSLVLAASSQFVVKIDGMTCRECAETIKDALSKIDGVDKASLEVTLKSKQAKFSMHDDKPTLRDAIKKTIEDLGYKVTEISTSQASTNSASPAGASVASAAKSQAAKSQTK